MWTGAFIFKGCKEKNETQSREDAKEQSLNRSLGSKDGCSSVIQAIKFVERRCDISTSLLLEMDTKIILCVCASVRRLPVRGLR
jgi:hypothetical protein